MKEILLTNKVYLKKCPDYSVSKDIIIDIIENIIKDNGFDDDFKDKKVVIKPNLLAKREPQAAVTTEPCLVTFAAEYFIKKGAKVIIADSPGGAYQLSLLSAIYKASGIYDASKEAGAELNEDLGYKTVSYSKGLKSKTFNIINPLADADLIVNISRMKTHALCEMTAAVKNMFGSIPGLQKAEQHARFPKRSDFADYLVDLCLCNAPQINIIDGVVAMEGNGPASGTIKKPGVIIASANPFSADLLCSYLMEYKNGEVGTVRKSIKRGLCPDSVQKLDIDGENPDDYKLYFRRPDGTAGGLLKQLPDVLGGKVQKLLEPRPVVEKKKCVGCGECAKSCPEKTIDMLNNKAVIKSEKCIKCYCCQELCPMKAIKVKRNVIMKIIEYPFHK